MGRIGYTPCGCCGQSEAAVSETATGTLSITCHKCQFSAFAKAGTKAARLIREKLTPDEDAPAPVAAPTTTVTTPAPTLAKNKRSPFSMANL